MNPHDSWPQPDALRGVTQGTSACSYTKDLSWHLWATQKVTQETTFVGCSLKISIIQMRQILMHISPFVYYKTILSVIV